MTQCQRKSEMPEKIRVLLIEDNLEDAEYIRLLFEFQVEETFQVRTESRLAGGLALLDEETFDVILLDLGLPDSTGIGTLLSVYKKRSNIPIVVLTGLDDADLANEAMQEGAQDCLVKGQFTSELLKRAIRYAVGRQMFMEEIRSYALQLIESEHRFRQIIANNADLMVVTDQTGRILYMNPAARDVFREVSSNLPAGVLSFEDEKMREIEFEVARGDLRILQVRTVGTEWDGEKVFLASIRDITLRRAAEKDVLHASEMERQRVGKELHDGLGQNLTALAFFAKALSKQLEVEGSNAAAKAQELATGLNEAIKETTCLSRGLYPVGLEKAGLVHALADLAKQVDERFGVKCCFNSDSEDLPLETETAFHLYRIAQEAIHNAVRHGKATLIEIKATSEESHFSMVIKDNGIGFKAQTKEEGMGLRNMAYRADLISARLEVISLDGHGTIVSVNLKAPAGVKFK